MRLSKTALASLALGCQLLAMPGTLLAGLPVGVWSCLIFEPRGLNEKTVLVHFQAEGALRVAPQDGLAAPIWRELDAWRVDGGNLFFSDPSEDIGYEGFFNGETISGLWRSSQTIGEWWCSPVEMEVPVLGPTQRAAGKTRFPLPKPATLATPVYPLDAIRRGTEGQVVICFRVSHEGVVLDPQVVRETEEIFREPAVTALLASRYVPWRDGGTEPARPACRTYTFRLTAQSSADP